MTGLARGRPSPKSIKNLFLISCYSVKPVEELVQRIITTMRTVPRKQIVDIFAQILCFHREVQRNGESGVSVNGTQYSERSALKASSQTPPRLSLSQKPTVASLGEQHRHTQ